MRKRDVMTVLALGCGAACAGERPAQNASVEGADTPPAAAVAAAATATSPDTGAATSVARWVEGAIPRFAAGEYELVLDRDQPLFDDSLAVRAHVEGLLPWTAVDSARSWRDSARVFEAYLKGSDNTLGEAFESGEARTAADSAKVIWRLFDELRCTEWRAGGTLTLAADGHFTQRDELRSYCRGKEPAYTRRMERESASDLETCEAWEAPEPGIVPHLTCRSGRWWHGRIRYRYVGDTLRLNSDCDGSETYVLRRPDRPAGYAVARSSDISRLDEC